MKRRERSPLELGFFLALITVQLVLASCGGGASSSTAATPPPPVSNSQDVQVNLGPANNYVNGRFTDVTICVPGSTNCQTIQNVMIDTGSEGIRLLSSQVSLSLPAISDSNGNALQECVAFADGSYVWGPIVGADVQLAEEKATSVPVQTIYAPNEGFAVPS